MAAMRVQLRGMASLNRADRCVPHRPSCANRFMLRRCIVRSNEEKAAATTTTEQRAQAGLAAPAAAAAADGSAPGSQQQQPQWRWEESDDSVMAYGALAGLLVLGLVPALQEAKLADLPYFIGLAVCTQYIGAHKGLTSQQRQMISVKEGALAPVLASVSLFGCYLLIKYLPGFSIQGFLNAYFFLLGSFALSGASIPLFRKIGGPLGEPSLRMPVPEGLLVDDDNNTVTEAEFAPSDVLAVALSLGAAAAELASNHSNYTLNNLVACLIATDILQLVGLRSFRTAGLMLLGLLAYDVFWVFGSPSVIGDNVMLTVATSDIITGPMRLLFPRAMGGVGEASEYPFSLLGLGDIAVPGLLACLALRYDASRATDMRARAQAAAGAVSAALAEVESSSSGRDMGNLAAAAAERAFDEVADREVAKRSRTTDGSNASANSPAGDDGTQDQDHAHHAHQGHTASEAVLQQRTYFTAVAASYVAGLLIAFTANGITGLGQPALLYIVPCTLGAVAATAVSRGELPRVWSYTDVASYGPLAVANADAEKKKHGGD